MNTNAQLIDAVLFDLGGVLVNIDFECTFEQLLPYSKLTRAALRGAFSQDTAYQQHERGELDGTAYFQHLRETLRLDATDNEIASAWNALLMDEITPTVAALKLLSATMPCFLYSNSNPTHQKLWADRHAGMLGHFQKQFVSSEIGMRKPEVESYLWIANQIGVASSRILFFDDHEDNVNGAIAAGLNAVQVSSPRCVRDGLLKYDLM